MDYPIEINLASKNGWFTPQEARNYYGRYDRHGITWHWWGDGTGASNHDNIVRYINAGAAQGQKSVNYVLSDNKITLCVNPDNVAWTSQSGNPVSVSVELQPTLNAEGYKKAGWLAAQLAERYGGDRAYYPHKYWNSTQCPGTISLDRIRQEEDKHQRGEYNPTPTPTPTPTPVPTPVNVTFATITPQTFVCNKQPTKLYQVNKATWGEIGVVKEFNKGERIDVYGVVRNSKLGSEHYVTKYSFDNKIANGFSKADLDPYVAPIPTPPPVEEPTVVDVTNKTMYSMPNAKLMDIKAGTVVKTFPVDTPMEISAKVTWKGMEYYQTEYGYTHKTGQGFLVGDLKDMATPAPVEPTPVPNDPAPKPEDPEWVQKLRDIDDTKYWVTEDTELIDITTGKPSGDKTFKKDESFVGSALTIANGVEYRITEYSYKKNIFKGVPIKKLTLTEPGVPNIPPVPADPNLVDKNVVILFLESVVKLITDFIASLRKK